MMLVRHTATDYLEVTDIGGGDWRVCDNRIPASNAQSVLGLISHVEDHYEVIAMNHPSESTDFPSFTEAVNSLRPAPSPLL
ncbi:hypothetical protein [Lysinibacter cavernae]|uniref:Uncharacterized protein n=1 Tax=Lysinibacter cavernae TaxID=1640652 RepID=A0A7X5R0L1_9MICO|nr:hypothetical protein [Lysinibacter cavernae]NIH53307.1 hypothetical protein [Lysinibacter cavernae]